MNKYSIAEFNLIFDRLSVNSRECKDLIFYDLIYDYDDKFYRCIIIFDFENENIIMNSNIGNFNGELEELDNDDIEAQIILLQTKFLINNLSMPKVSMMNNVNDLQFDIIVSEPNNEVNELIKKYKNMVKDLKEHCDSVPEEFFDKNREDYDGNDIAIFKELSDKDYALQEISAIIDSYFIQEDFLNKLAKLDCDNIEDCLIDKN
ncbi:MAG: hypothetical protein LBR40_04910 [Bacilli bacterium]|jgi:hypothetical protein|nr:hypothetical protein [Bacilli bacterium]